MYMCTCTCELGRRLLGGVLAGGAWMGVIRDEEEEEVEEEEEEEGVEVAEMGAVVVVMVLRVV